MINTTNKVRLQNTENLKTDNHTFQRLNEFKNLGVHVTKNSEIKTEIKTRNHSRKWVLSHTQVIKIYSSITDDKLFTGQ
jgi:hypothetical protein